MTEATKSPVLVIEDLWLSQILGKKASLLDTAAVSKDELAHFLTTVKKDAGSFFLYSKISAEDFESAKILENHGFAFADCHVVFEKNVQAAPDNPSEAILREASSADEVAVTEIARNNFKYSRFHKDLKIGVDRANQLKSEWARNFFYGRRGNAMYVAVWKGKVRGFIQMIHKNDSQIVDLIAVDKCAQGIGIGRGLMLHAENEARRFNKIIVGTQASNLPSVRLYEKLGYRLTKAQWIFHYHG